MREPGLTGQSEDLLRRAHCLVASWADGCLTATNYLAGVMTRLTWPVLGLLDAFTGPTPRAVVRERLAVAAPDPDALLGRLLDAQLLLAVGSPDERRDAEVDGTWRWDLPARHFHYATRKTRFRTDPDAVGPELAARARVVPPPPPYTDRGTDTRCLGGSFTDTPASPADDRLWPVLRRRRTVREYTGEPITMSELDTLLLWVWGRTHEVHDPDVGDLILKTSPSGGSRHPVEVYPVVLGVAGLAPGVYHYSVRGHGLERVGPAVPPRTLVRLCANQSWVADAAVAFVMTGSLPRIMWKYPQAHAYRVLHLDAGHLGQTFHLVSTALGLAPFTTAALDQELLETHLGLDPVAEPVLYTAVVGRPKPAP